jgi:hypothetical protein
MRDEKRVVPMNATNEQICKMTRDHVYSDPGIDPYYRSLLKVYAIPIRKESRHD